MHVIHRQQASSPTLRNGLPKAIGVRREKRSGNKIVTVVTHVDAFGFPLEAIAKAWRKRLATGVSVVDPKKSLSNVKTSTIVPLELHVQGPFAEIDTVLCNEMGIPKAYAGKR
jgi:translation initiation factor 1 (eIF-1/SUI1)